MANGIDQSILDEFDESLANGKNNYEKKRYTAAWQDFYNAYKLKKNYFKSKRVTEKNINDKDYALVCYYLAQVLKNIQDDELLDTIVENDEDTIKNGYKGEKARKFLGRKYLKLAADKDNDDAIVEYALNCMGYAPQGKLDFSYNKDNQEIALYWAKNIMKSSKNIYVASMGYCIHAIYCLDRYKETNDEKYLNDFASNILIAKDKNNDQFNEYIYFYLGYLYSFPKLKDYEDGRYFDYQKGYDMFSEVYDKADDYYLIRNARSLKEKLKKII